MQTIMSNKRVLAVMSTVSVFLCLVIGIFVLVRSGVVSLELGLLMLICLLGMYVGFGILIAVYQLVNKLE